MNHGDIVRGEEAHRLLESKIFKEAVQNVENEIIRRWRVSTTLEEREELFAQQRALAGIAGSLKAIADDGRIAASRSADR